MEGASCVVATSRYHAGKLIVASGLVPLGVTVGSARWLPYELGGAVGPLAPYGEVDGTPLRKIEDDAVFDQVYGERLAQYGVEALARLFETYAELYAAPGVVLLCFEKVLEGEECHRRSFARWWEEQSGQVVPELAPTQTDLVTACSCTLDEAQLLRVDLPAA